MKLTMTYSFTLYDKLYLDICEESNCDGNATCGSETSYQCVCREGFRGNGTFCEGNNTRVDILSYVKLFASENHDSIKVVIVPSTSVYKFSRLQGRWFAGFVQNLNVLKYP